MKKLLILILILAACEERKFEYRESNNYSYRMILTKTRDYTNSRNGRILSYDIVAPKSTEFYIDKNSGTSRLYCRNAEFKEWNCLLLDEIEDVKLIESKPN